MCNKEIKKYIPGLIGSGCGTGAGSGWTGSGTGAMMEIMKNIAEDCRCTKIFLILVVHLSFRDRW